MKKIYLFILLSFFISSFVFSQTPDNKVPMYGEVPKSKEYQKMDEEFIQAVVKQFGSKEKAYENHIRFGLTYFYHDSLTISMKRFNQAWLLNPDGPESYFAFAALTEIRGNLQEADRLYKMGLAKDLKKDRAETFLLKIADCAEHIGNMKVAINTYKKINEINPKNAFAYKKLGYFYSSLDMSAEALANYTKAIELEPGDAMTYNNRGYFYQKNKNYEKAIADYSKAIDLDPKYISAYVNRGLTRTEIKDLEGANKTFNAVLIWIPNLRN